MQRIVTVTMNMGALTRYFSRQYRPTAPNLQSFSLVWLRSGYGWWWAGIKSCLSKIILSELDASGLHKALCLIYWPLLWWPVRVSKAGCVSEYNMLRYLQAYVNSILAVYVTWIVSHWIDWSHALCRLNARAPDSQESWNSDKPRSSIILPDLSIP